MFNRDGMLCIHCGAREEKLFPMAIGGKRGKAAQLIVEAFSEEHEDCEETDQSPSRRIPRTPKEWLDGYDVGRSSGVICLVMSGAHDGNWRDLQPGPTPSDPGDFGRCYRLLKHFPEWRPRMHEVADRFPETKWPALVAAWDELSAMYEQELPTGTAPKLYARMKEILGERT